MKKIFQLLSTTFLLSSCQQLNDIYIATSDENIPNNDHVFLKELNQLIPESDINFRIDNYNDYNKDRKVKLLIVSIKNDKNIDVENIKSLQLQIDSLAHRHLENYPEITDVELTYRLEKIENDLLNIEEITYSTTLYEDK